jgi:hypothetical protein
MSTRERWIVYPLLFLALGLALRDKLIPPSRFRCGRLEVVEADCLAVRAGVVALNDLTVVGPEGTRRVWVGNIDNQGGQVQIYGTDGQPRLVAGVDQTGRSGIVETMAADQKPQAMLHSVGPWGSVTTFGPDEVAACRMGSNGPLLGVFAELPKKGESVPLTRPFETPSLPAKPPQEGGQFKPLPK